MKITTQDVWIAVDSNERLPPSWPVPFTDYHSTHWLEKKSGMVVLTKEQLDEIVDNFLRCYPEYRCLDVIGKFANHKHSNTIITNNH